MSPAHPSLAYPHPCCQQTSWDRVSPPETCHSPWTPDPPRSGPASTFRAPGRTCPPPQTLPELHLIPLALHRAHILPLHLSPPSDFKDSLLAPTFACAHLPASGRPLSRGPASPPRRPSNAPPFGLQIRMHAQAPSHLARARSRPGRGRAP